MRVNFLKIFLLLFCAFALTPTFQTREYITQEQLNEANVIDLPGRIAPDLVRERDAENMTANAVSKVSSLLSNYTGLTLGMVGGIATLGFVGVLSAPVAMIGAALVGGLALVGTSSDKGAFPRGLSQPNAGLMGGSPINYGVRRNESGIMGNVFGWSNPNRTAQYNVGSIGVGSANRAPVHVNMHSPHVMNTVGRGYGFTQYDNAGPNPMSMTSGLGTPGMAFSQFDAGRSPMAAMGGMPLSPGSSNKAPTSAGSSPGAPYYGGNGGFGAYSGYGYPGQNPQYGIARPGYGNPWNTNMNPGGYWQQQKRPATHYDRRSGESFDNFFTRIDAPGIQGGERGTRTDRSGERHMFFNGPNPYSYNWRQTAHTSDNFISQSWQYQNTGGWKATSPQGRVQRPLYNTPMGGAPAPAGPLPTTQQPTTNYQTQGAGSHSSPGNMPRDPFAYQFARPTQHFDHGVAMRYPMGNAYNNPAVPNNYNVNFQVPNVNTGYQPHAYYPQQTGFGPNSIGPASNIGLHNKATGQGAPPVTDAMGNRPAMINGAVAPPERTVPKVGYVNTNAAPQVAQQAQEAREAAGQTVISNQAQAMFGAMAPESSGFDHGRLSELEDARQAVYKKLLDAVKRGHDEDQKKFFDEYQSITDEINDLKN